jgi:hypothetical protein
MIRFKVGSGQEGLRPWRKRKWRCGMAGVDEVVAEGHGDGGSARGAPAWGGKRQSCSGRRRRWRPQVVRKEQRWRKEWMMVKMMMMMSDGDGGRRGRQEEVMFGMVESAELGVGAG